jgi:hypothetical protein
MTFSSLSIAGKQSPENFYATERERIHQTCAGGYMSRRAELLASRIEEGAAGLAAFAEKLSEAEWDIPMSLGNDRRPVGTIVHHVATMYPLEIDLARAIAGGQTVPGVTWDDVANLNAKHAREVAGVSKAATLELLRKNSREAAAAVREFTDEELDRAAPLPLVYGAPVTAQFVIEDHALRHSWHHLWRIRAALEQASQPLGGTREETRSKAS